MTWWNNSMMIDRPLLGAGFGLLALWTIVWKGLALWKAARNDERYWYIALLVLNTAGILEILYLFFFAKEKLRLVSDAPKKKTSKK